MPLLLTNGLGSYGDGTGSSLLNTSGLGDPGDSLVPECKALQLLAVESYGPYLILSFSKHLNMDARGLDKNSWLITTADPAAVAVRVLGVTDLGSARIRLDVDEQTKDAIYTVAVPRIGIVDTVGNAINADEKRNFFGFGVPVSVSLSRSIDARTLEVVFTEGVIEQDAITVSNYSVTPALQILKAVKVTDSVYRLTTSKQTELVTYTVTVQNIRDLARNQIDSGH